MTEILQIRHFDKKITTTKFNSCLSESRKHFCVKISKKLDTPLFCCIIGNCRLFLGVAITFCLNWEEKGRV